MGRLAPAELSLATTAHCRHTTHRQIIIKIAPSVHRVKSYRVVCASTQLRLLVPTVQSIRSHMDVVVFLRTLGTEVVAWLPRQPVVLLRQSGGGIAVIRSAI